MACESLIQAKKIAVQKGLSADSVTCPIEEFCSKKVCTMFSDLQQLEIDQQDPKYIENTKQP